MAIKITDDCINCESCEAECPNNAIYVPEENRRFSDGTSMTDDPACDCVCPIDCCVDDEDTVEN